MWALLFGPYYDSMVWGVDYYKADGTHRSDGFGRYDGYPERQRGQRRHLINSKNNLVAGKFDFIMPVTNGDSLGRIPIFTFFDP